MRYLLCILITFASLSLLAQHPYFWTLTTEDGLPSLEIYDLYEGSKGYIWMGTDKGLCKYNGKTFSYYKNKDQKGEALSGIQEDKKGRIWVRNFKEQVFYVENDSLHRLNKIDELQLNNLGEFIINQDAVIYIMDKSKNLIHKIWESEKDWQTQTFDLKDPKLGEDLLLHHIVEVNGVLYVLTLSGMYYLSGTELIFIDDNNLRKYDFYKRPAIEYGELIKRDSSLVILQSEYRTLKFNELVSNKIKEIQGCKNQNYLKDKEIISARYLADSSCWMLTKNAGVVEVLTAQNNMKKEGAILFPNEGISDILIDREGNYWVSSLENGVHIIPKLMVSQTPSKKWNVMDGKLGVMAVKDTTHFFLATNDKQILLLSHQQELEHTYHISSIGCSNLYWNQKELCVSGNRILYFFQASSADYHRIYPKIPTIKNTYIYNENILIIATGTAGLTMVMNTRDTASLDTFPNNIFPSIPTNHYYRSGIINNVYIKGVGGRRCNWVIGDEAHRRFITAYFDTLMCYPEQGQQFPILDQAGKSIKGTFLEKGNNNLIWICTVEEGIYAIDEDLQAVYHFTTKDGLINNMIKKLRVARDGTLWLLGNEGVQSFHPETKESHLYTLQDGLPTHEIRDILLLDEKVWLSTAKGLVTFDQNMPSKNKVEPLIYIKGVAIHDKDTTVQEQYNLTYNQDNITIQVEGLAYRSRGAFQYKYRMLGIDTLWRYQNGQINFMRFPQLQPGAYQFEVKAVNEDGIESEKIASIVFNIAPPYWKTWWFFLLFIFGIGLILFSIIWNYWSRLKLENQNSNLKMEALQSQMNPHFIFNVLTAVQNLWMQHKNELAMDLQSNFAKLLRKIFQYSSKRAITIEQVEEFLENYLNLEQIRFENKVDIDFRIEEILLEDDYYIPPLLIQPVIENSFKHGLFHKKTNRHLTIVLKEAFPYLYCCVEDNGVGRKLPLKRKKERRSSGLSTTRERLLILQQNIIKKPHPHHNLKITDLKNPDGSPKGTRVELWIPFITSDL